ncbi:MAG: hypothetical protein G01um10142_398 [Parcubacteria group bacterium Gr01-1014_2]|nr:MAG: hypothetical protein G01um10142_398 [Parcubacteria group bacterium Gr01-1014_2]
MYLLIPLILVAGSALGIGYIVWPKFREVKAKGDLAEVKEDFWHLMFPELMHFFNFAQSKFKVFKRNAAVDYEKFLRRVKILSLRTHNLTDKLLEKRQKNDIKTEFKEANSPSNGQAVNIYFKAKENNLIAEISKNPKDKNLYKSLAALYMESKMFDDAEEAYNVVLELDPNDLESMEALEKIGKMV